MESETALLTISSSYDPPRFRSRVKLDFLKDKFPTVYSKDLLLGMYF